MDEFLKKRIGILCVTHETPKSLRNSMESWKKSGLLDLVDEKILWVNSVEAKWGEHGIGREFGFRVIDPMFMAWSKLPRDSTYLPTSHPSYGHRMFKSQEHQDNYPHPLMMMHDNSFTFPVSFYWGVQLAQSDFILVLEKDFAVDTDLTPDEMAVELWGAAYMMGVHGIPYIRMRSRKDLGTSGLPDCTRGGCGYTNGGNSWVRQANQFNFYNGGFTQNVDDCLPKPRVRCYSNVDANWSNNAMMLSKTWAVYTYRDLVDVAGFMWNNNGDFEVEMLNRDWGHTAQVNMCLMYDGLFLHKEIDG